MKKNISINISGIIFHIEEDGYDQLKEYLSSINKYFSTFDDSNEIIADIESRIAEIFLSKLNEGKQVITIKDVEALMTTMGGIQDFQAVEEDSTFSSQEDESEESEEPTKEQEHQQKEEGPADRGLGRKLYRDKRRRLIGGVAAGIAHYFSIDPLWIRLIFIALLFDVFITFSLSGLIIIAYIVLWVVLPESDELEEDKHLKKMYRNPEGSVIGGVANGVAAYFEVDVAIIRVLFVLTFFAGGVGLIAYLVLWIILPEAKRITDKVKMKGKAVTLENIDSNIKQRIEKKAAKDGESAFVKVLLFPFRLIATILVGLGRAFGPIFRFILEAVRVVAGLLLIVIGIALLFTVLVSGGVFVGLLAGSHVLHMNIIPLQLVQETLPTIGFIAGMIVVGIPSFALIFVGLSVISKSRVVSPTVGWAMFALWLLGLIGLSFTLPSVIYNFRTEGTYSETSYYDTKASSVFLDLNNLGDEDYQGVRLRLRGYDGSRLKLNKNFTARGASRRDAVEEARSIEYEVIQNDSIFTFDSNLSFGRDAKFRGQELLLTLYIPFGQKFTISDDLIDIIYNSFGIQGYGSSQISDNVWAFNPSGLDCLTCTDYTASNDSRRDSYDRLYHENMSTHGNAQTFQNTDFNELSISGPFKINIVYGDNYRVVLEGSQRFLDQCNVSQDADELSVDYNQDYDLHQFNRRVVVKIITPKLSKIRLRGATKGDVSGFEADEMTVDLAGAVDATVDADIYTMTVEMKGASKLELVGSGNELDADVSTASYLSAYSYKVKDATIRATGVSKAQVYASNTLNIHASLVSEVEYRGGAEVNISDTSSLSHIEKD